MAGRGRRAGWLASGLGAAAVTLAGCASDGTARSDAAPTAPGTVVPANQPALPTAALLKAALLAPSDMGSAFTEQARPDGSSPTGTTAVTGCPQLGILLKVGAGTSATDQGVTYQAGADGPTVGESLITAPPAALAAAYSDDRSALLSCKNIEIKSAGATLALTLSPITFGGAQSAAVRMDGMLEGVQVDAYLAIDDVGPAELAYFYLQVGSGSSQVASAYFRQADAKAHQLATTS